MRKIAFSDVERRLHTPVYSHITSWHGSHQNTALQHMHPRRPARTGERGNSSTQAYAVEGASLERWLHSRLSSHNTAQATQSIALRIASRDFLHVQYDTYAGAGVGHSSSDGRYSRGAGANYDGTREEPSRKVKVRHDLPNLAVAPPPLGQQASIKNSSSRTCSFPHGGRPGRSGKQSTHPT